MQRRPPSFLCLGTLLAVASSLLVAVSAEDSNNWLPLNEWFAKPIHGRSTYYGNYAGGGACGLDQPDGSPIPPELKGIDFTVALDQPQFNVGGCGMCIQLNGTGTGAGGNPVTGTYTVFVNNLCPECEYGHLDFATPGDGSWDIYWKAVPCDVGDHNMRFVFKGSNDFYLKLSTQATRYPTKAIRLKSGDRWMDGTPVNGNYFEFRDGAPYDFPMKVEVTSVFGETLLDEIASLQGGPSHIQYQRGAPTDEQMDEAEPGEEPATDDDIEQPKPSDNNNKPDTPPQPTPVAPGIIEEEEEEALAPSPAAAPATVSQEMTASRQLLRGAAALLR